MRSDRVLAVILGAGLVSAAANPGGDNYSFGHIVWTGIIKEREYTLHGDARSVLRRIRSIDPDYVANYTDPNGRELEKRTSTLICGNYATASYSTIGSGAGGLIKDLALLGGTCAVPAGQHSCSRISCRDTSAIYLCNDNENEIAPSCNDLSKYASAISNACSGSSSSAFSGQQFNDDDVYNVVVAYGNCNDYPNVAPSDYNSPGPNGSPAKTGANSWYGHNSVTKK